MRVTHYRRPCNCTAKCCRVKGTLCFLSGNGRPRCCGHYEFAEIGTISQCSCYYCGRFMELLETSDFYPLIGPLLGMHTVTIIEGTVPKLRLEGKGGS